MNTFHFEIVSPEGIVYTDEVDEVLLPTQKGEIGIFPHHVPLFTKLCEGEVRIKKGREYTSVAINGGFVEVDKTKVMVLSDYAVRADTIEIAHAEEAKRQAQKLLAEKHSEEDFTLISKDLQRALLELKVAEKVRNRQRSS